MKPTLQPLNHFDLVFYTDAQGDVDLDVYFADESMWMNQYTIADLFKVERSVVTKHIRNIFASGELDEEATCAKIAQVQKEGNRSVQRQVDYYNLDVVISVGYRVNSIEATRFRKFATRILHEYIQKGSVINSERYKKGMHFDEAYFNAMLEKIREIRLSERRVYLKLTDIFATASDYEKTSEYVKEFFAFMQNKLHFAIAQGTAAEIICNRADANKKHMGLTHWETAPMGKILRSDVVIAKNYLSQEELEQLALMVSALLDMAELRAKNRKITTMRDWIDFMNRYIDLNELPKLEGKGSVSKFDADKKALSEYDTFRLRQDKEFIGDFDNLFRIGEMSPHGGEFS
jgi:hypothetical protein